MPDREVETIRDLIFYQYAKVIARRAFATEDGAEAKRRHYGFVRETLRKLKGGAISWSDVTREDRLSAESEKRCIYCGNESGLHREHLVPKSLRIKASCESCDTIQGIRNQVLACGPCNSLKGTKGLYEFYKVRLPRERKFYDFIPPLAEKKYLKTIIECHGCAETLYKGDLDGDGVLTVLDIDSVLA